MGRFVKHVFVFLIAATLLLQGVSLGIIASDFKVYYGYPGAVTYKALSESKKKSKAKKLILGDSVARQFYEPGRVNSSTVSLACNQAVSLCGQYLLLENYFQAGNHPDSVTLLLTPTSLRNDLNQVFTFHYFLKPFYTQQNMRFFSDQVLNEIDKVPFKNLSQIPSVKASKWAPDYGEKWNKNGEHIEVSEISIEYIDKIQTLCETRGIGFSLMPGPVTDSLRTKCQNTLLEVGDHKYSKIEQLLTDYFEEITFLDDSLFSDGTHVKSPKNIAL